MTNLLTDHENSLAAGRAFREAYIRGSDNADELLEQYRAARRLIEPVNGVRYGANEAYSVTQGFKS